jgi:hypothetical protein
MLIGYAWEHLQAAVQGIVCSVEPLQQRLAGAILNDINFIQERHVPPEVWARLAVMNAEFCTISPKEHENSIIATTSQMSDSEARKWLKEILHLYEEVCREYARQEFESRRGFGLTAR